MHERNKNEIRIILSEPIVADVEEVDLVERNNYKDYAVS